MCRCSSFIAPSILTIAGIAAVAGSIAFAQQGTTAKKPAAAPAAQPEMELPPGMSMEDMQACIAAATPGKMHEMLAKSVGTWSVISKMWMAPGTDPEVSTGTYIATSLLDGRFFQGEMKTEGKTGPFHGIGLCGYDNVTEKFVGTWIDSWSTGIMSGTGTLAADGTTLNWNYTMNCPITKGVQTMREVQTMKGANEILLEMYTPDRATGKEYKMLEIKLTRTGAAPAAAR